MGAVAFRQRTSQMVFGGRQDGPNDVAERISVVAAVEKLPRMVDRFNPFYDKYHNIPINYNIDISVFVDAQDFRALGLVGQYHQNRQVGVKNVDYKMVEGLG